jgi:parvulin-like peptidyl-prolyl cis-trans isomerase-like protein
MKKVSLCSMGLASLASLVVLGLPGIGTRPGYSQQAPAKPTTQPAAPSNPSAPGNPSAPSAPSATPGDPANQPVVPPDKVVIKVGDKQVTAGEVDFLIQTLSPQDQKALATQGKASLGDQYIQMLVLEQQALRDHLDATPDFRRSEEFERTRRLAAAEYQKVAGEVKVSPEEIAQYYASHSADFDRVEARQVAIRVKPVGAKADTPGLSLAEAKARAEEIRKALAAPGADAQKIATQFAVPNLVFIDAQSRNVERGQLPADLADTIFKLKDGEISETRDTPQSVFFVQALKHVHPEVKEVSSSIEGVVRQEKLAAAMGELKNKTSIWSDDEFFAPKAASGPTSPAAPAAKASADNPAVDKQAPAKQPPK